MFVCYVIYGQTKYSAVTSLISYSVSWKLIDFLSLLSFLLRTFILRFSPIKNTKTKKLHLPLFTRSLPALFCLACSGGSVVGVGAVVEVQCDVQHGDPAAAEALQLVGPRLGRV